jgi:diguanylate cyclase (GGDEF)-like protein
MKRVFGSKKVQAAPHDQARSTRRVSGTVRVPNVSANATQPHAKRREQTEYTDSPEHTAGDNDLPTAPRANASLHGQFAADTGPSTVRVRVSAPALSACAIAVVALAAHFLLPTGVPQLVVPIAPLTFLLVARDDNRRMQWAVYAGLLWLAIAWAEMVRPMAGALTTVYRLVELTSLAGIFVVLFEAERFMQHLSQRDPLTGLLNRRGFEQLGATELKRAARYDRPIAFALLDVDRFKSVNDQYGHAVGDRVLRIVSEELLKLRISDLAVRLGGDEFGLLMPETDAAGAVQLVSRLRQRIHLRMFEQGWPVTISAGVASSASCRRRLPDLIAEADTQMYACKVAERG